MPADGTNSFSSNTTYDFISPADELLIECTPLTVGTMTFGFYHPSLAGYRTHVTWTSTSTTSAIMSCSKGLPIRVTLAGETAFPIVFTWMSAPKSDYQKKP